MVHIKLTEDHIKEYDKAINIKERNYEITNFMKYNSGKKKIQLFTTYGEINYPEDKAHDLFVRAKMLGANNLAKAVIDSINKNTPVQELSAPNVKGKVAEKKLYGESVFDTHALDEQLQMIKARRSSKGIYFHTSNVGIYDSNAVEDIIQERQQMEQESNQIGRNMPF